MSIYFVGIDISKYKHDCYIISATDHYALNLELFLENACHSFMEVSPVLIKEYEKSTTLRRIKTDSVVCESIALWLMTVEYNPIQKDFTTLIP